MKKHCIGILVSLALPSLVSADGFVPVANIVNQAKAKRCEMVEERAQAEIRTLEESRARLLKTARDFIDQKQMEGVSLDDIRKFQTMRQMDSENNRMLDRIEQIKTALNNEEVCK